MQAFRDETRYSDGSCHGSKPTCELYQQAEDAVLLQLSKQIHCQALIIGMPGFPIIPAKLQNREVGLMQRHSTAQTSTSVPGCSTNLTALSHWLECGRNHQRICFRLICTIRGIVDCLCRMCRCSHSQKKSCRTNFVAGCSRSRRMWRNPIMRAKSNCQTFRKSQRFISCISW